MVHQKDGNWWVTFKTHLEFIWYAFGMILQGSSRINKIYIHVQIMGQPAFLGTTKRSQCQNLVAPNLYQLFYLTTQMYSPDSW